MTQEALKLALDALENHTAIKHPQQIHYRDKAITAIKEALAQPEQEPVVWVSENVCEGQYIDGRPRKIWWECEKGVGTAFYTHPPQRTEERNFCPRCGKRTADLTVIHTCTPPQNIEQDLSEQGRKKSAILGNNIEEMVNNGLPFLTALDTALKVYDHHTPRLHPPQRTEPQIKTTDPFESAKVRDYNRGWNDCLFASGIVKQSQHTWVGLTDEEVKHEWEIWRANLPRYAGFAKGIEAKLKEKNT